MNTTKPFKKPGPKPLVFNPTVTAEMQRERRMRQAEEQERLGVERAKRTYRNNPYGVSERINAVEKEFAARGKLFTLTDAFESELKLTKDPISSLTNLLIYLGPSNGIAPPKVLPQKGQLELGLHLNPVSKRLITKFWETKQRLVKHENPQMLTMAMIHTVMDLRRELVAEETKKRQ